MAKKAVASKKTSSKARKKPVVRTFDGTDYKKIPAWKNVTQKQWNDYTWQLQNQIRTVEELRELIPLTDEEVQGVRDALARFRMAITPYYLSLIDPANPVDPVKLQSIPSGQEAITRSTDMADPLAEDEDSPAPSLTHRYPDRALMLVTDVCSMYCRHCTRRRLVGDHDAHMSKAIIKQQIAYLKKTPQVRDVIISGGDPLMLSDEMLEYVVSQVRAIPHVEIIRIGTRTPVVMPMRITNKLVKMLSKYHPIYINTHFNHPKEITPAAKEATERLANSGFPIGNQTVLMQGVNDCPHVMRALMTGLLKIRVRPYYIFQCDLSEGIGHFRTPISTGISIIESLRGHVSGLAVPTYVVDAPGGGGKVPVMPNYTLSASPGQVILRNFEGIICRYNEEGDYSSSCGRHAECSDPRFAPKEGPAKMLQDPDMLTIGPTPERKKRIGPKP